ncbi:MAG TPA: DUF3187 family protein [Myxococcaceae bacterium]
MGAGICAALLASIATLADSPLRPIPWQNPAPLDRLFLQQPFEAPEPEGPGLSVQFLSANMFLKGGRPGGFQYEIDEEIATFSFTGRLRIGERWGLSLMVPLVVQYGGWLDPVIDGVEKLLHARSARRGSEPFRTTARFGTPGGPVLEQDGPGASLGDVTLGAQGQLLTQDGLRPALALRAGLKFPTGGGLAGSGTWDVGGGVLAGWEVEFLAVHLAFDVALPRGRLHVLELPTGAYASVQMGFGFRVSEAVGLHLQLSGHTSPLHVEDTPGLSGSTFYVLAGAEWHVLPEAGIALSVAENFLSPGRGADFSVLLGLRFTPGAASQTGRL